MNDVIIYLLKSTALLTVFFGFYFLLLRKDTSFITNRRFLLGGVIASAILPAVYFTRTIIIEATAQPLHIVQGNYQITEVVAAEPSISATQVLLFIYFAGVAFMLGRLLFQSASLVRILFSEKRLKHGSLHLVQTKRKVAPFSFLNYIVYNPSLHSETELKHILNHEKVHVTQWHTADVLLANLNLIYQWFNPIAWLYIKNLQQNLEFIADSEAVKEAPCKKEYQKALVKISVENVSLSLTNNFYQSLIKKRIIMLNKKNSAESNFWKAGLIIPALLAFLLIFNVKTVAQVKEQNSASETTETIDVVATVTKTSTEEDLENVKRIFGKKGLIVDFTKLDRTPDGIITAVRVELKNSPGNLIGNYFSDEPGGIEPFQIFVKGSGETGFSEYQQSSDSSNAGNNSLFNIGKEPLYIINNKEYSAAELAGKSILLENGYIILTPVDAVNKYGNKAKDGAVIVSEGKIINDFNEELIEIDEKNQKTNREYLQIEKGKAPALIALDNDPGNKKVEMKITPSGMKKGIGTRQTTVESLNLIEGEGDPVYVLNGTVLGNPAIAQNIAPEDVNSIMVIKGASATSLYGKAAKDGAVVIVTKAGDSLSTGHRGQGATTLKSTHYTAGGNSFTEVPRFRITTATYAVQDSSKNGTTFYFKKPATLQISSDGVNMGSSNSIGGNSRVFIASTENSNPPLYILEGKIMDADFNIKKIDHENIKAINVLNGDAAIKKYGTKGKNGVVEITLKDKFAKANPVGTYSVIKASTTDEGLKITKRQLQKQSDLKVDFKNIKRNRAGLITEIKVIARTDNEEIIGTFSETESINDIYVGVVNNKIYISSNAPNN